MTPYDDTIARPPRTHPAPAVSTSEPRPRPAPGPGWRHRADRAVSLLLVVQALSLFVVIPLGAATPYGRFLIDGCHLAFAGIAVTLLVRHHAVRALLVAGLIVLVGLPVVLTPGAGEPVRAALAAGAITAAAFLFNAAITAIVVVHVFGPGRITSHRIQGAILVYLNVAALFSIAYGFVTSFDPGAIARSDGGALPAAMGAKIAALTYVSLTTITTTGFGDLVPVHTLARSLANLESVFGHLFPATMLARLVALNVSHGRKG